MIITFIVLDESFQNVYVHLVNYLLKLTYIYSLYFNTVNPSSAVLQQIHDSNLVITVPILGLALLSAMNLMIVIFLVIKVFLVISDPVLHLTD